jgi:transcription elongation GreA/GreB family factor
MRPSAAEDVMSVSEQQYPPARGVDHLESRRASSRAADVGLPSPDGARPIEGKGQWPIDDRTMRDLLARIERLARAAMAGGEQRSRRQLDILRGHCGAVSVVFDPEVAAIGRRVTIGCEDGSRESFWLAFPGAEHTTANTVSVAAPVGKSLAGARVGEAIYVERDGHGQWAVLLDVA